MNPSPDPVRLRVCGEDLCGTIDRLGELHESLLAVLAAKEECLVAVDLDALSEAREEEEELLHRVVDEEKQRLIITEEIGDLLGHPAPGTIRVAEMLDALPDDLSERLSGARDRLRAAAVRLGKQNRTNRALVEHSLGHIQVFLSRLVNEEMLGAGYGTDGHESGGGSMLLDRRG